MDYWILDRFEGTFAICETPDGMADLPRALLPPQAAEGDLLYETPDGWQIDAAATAARRQAILEKRQRRTT